MQVKKNRLFYLFYYSCKFKSEILITVFLCLTNVLLSFLHLCFSKTLVLALFFVFSITVPSIFNNFSKIGLASGSDGG